MAATSEDLSACEGFAVDRIAAACGQTRQGILAPLLQIRSLFISNRSAFEVVRARLEDGTPPTTNEGMSALLQTVGAVVGSLSITYAPALATAVVAALGISAGLAPLVTLGILAIAAMLIWWPVSNAIGFVKDFIAFLRASFSVATG